MDTWTPEVGQEVVSICGRGGKGTIVEVTPTHIKVEWLPHLLHPVEKAWREHNERRGWKYDYGEREGTDRFRRDELEQGGEREIARFIPFTGTWNPVVGQEIELRRGYYGVSRTWITKIMSNCIEVGGLRFNMEGLGLASQADHDTGGIPYFIENSPAAERINWNAEHTPFVGWDGKA